MEGLIATQILGFLAEHKVFFINVGCVEFLDYLRRIS